MTIQLSLKILQTVPLINNRDTKKGLYYRGIVRGGGYKGSAPLYQENLWISGGFQAPTVTEPRPPGMKFKPHPGQIPDYTPDYI